MKIAYFNYLYDTNQDSVGASVHVSQFIEAVKQCGHEIKGFNLNPAPKSLNGELSQWSRLRQRLKKRLRKYVAQINQLIKNFFLFGKEMKILSDEKPEVLLIRYNMLNFTALVAAKLRGIPVVLEVNSPHALERKKLVKDVWQLPVIPFFIEWVNVNMADRIVTVSQSLKDYYTGKGVQADKISVIPNGVNAKRFNPGVDSSSVRERYNLQEKLVLGFVGSFHYWHGIDNILRLMDRVLSEYQKAAFLLVGDGPLQADCADAIAKKGWKKRAILSGYVKHNEVPQYVAAMDIVLAPYPPMEFFYFSPLKLFEYFSAGKAVVASDIGQIGELIEDGENGFLYPPDDFESLAEKTTLLIENPKLRQRLGIAGREKIINSYTWENNALGVTNLMAELLLEKKKEAIHH